MVIESFIIHSHQSLEFMKNSIVSCNQELRSKYQREDIKRVYARTV